MAGRVVVGIAEGKVRGEQVSPGVNSQREYFAFRGIPYAQPPVGNLRFKKPQPVAAWEGVLDATREAPVCPQRIIGSNVMTGHEDNCLALNVYTPKLSGGAVMPVVVYVHGGSFTFGSGGVEQHGPEYWMRRDVVLVTFNYRLGVLGFLTLGTDAVPGNAGLKDQVMVLRWVRRNIRQFSGDPCSVTLVGSSAGAVSVHFHMLSPMSTGLFHRAILMSGSSLSWWGLNEDAVRRGFRIGEVLGCASQHPQQLLDFLQTVPVFELVKHQSKVLTQQEKRGYKQYPFVPCLEPPGGAGERFLTEHPRTLLRRGLVAPVPVILGINHTEGMVILNTANHTYEYFKHIDANFSSFIPKMSQFPAIAPNKIKQFYFQENEISWKFSDTYFNFTGDVYFHLGIDEAVSLHLALGTAPVFCYRFTFEGCLGVDSWFLRKAYPRQTLQVTGPKYILFYYLEDVGLRSCVKTFGGKLHAGSEAYIFKLSDLPQAASEREVVNLMTAMFYQFALTGNPNPNGQSEVWEPAATQGQTWGGYLEVNKTLAMRNARLEQRLEFWDKLNRPKSNM